MADLALRRAKFQAAEKLYREVLAAKPGSVYCLNNCALAVSLTGQRHDEALRLINQAIQYAGPQGELLDTRGMVRLAAGQAAAAVDDFQKALAERSTPETLFHLALAHDRAGDAASAVKVFQPVAGLDFAQLQLLPSERPAFELLKKKV
jgi:Flp pilus assembly protein TadD